MGWLSSLGKALGGPLGFFVGFAVSYLQARKAQKDAKKLANSMAGVLVNKESAVEPLPVVYGERQIGGVRVFVATKDAKGGDPNEYLYMILALCEGEVEDITNITIDDLSLDTVEGAAKYSGNYLINKYYGTDSQTADATFVAANIGWTTNHRLRGVAYLAIRLLWDKNKFSSIPNITCKVKGKKVYDPRTLTTAWSDNPALCIRDYLTNTRYGKGLSSGVIDDTAFSAAADDCDNFTATVYSGGPTQRIFACNTVVDTGQTVFSNLEQLLLGCRGFIPYSQGKYSLLIDQANTSVMSFNTDNILSGISIRGETKDEKYNKVTCKFINPDNNWQEDAAFWPDAGSSEETAFLTEDNNVPLALEIELPTITNYYSARDIARVLCLRSRNAMRVQFTATSDALQLAVADVVEVTHPTPGFVDKPFQVEQIVMNYDGTVSLSLLEYNESIYVYDQSAQERSYPDTVLPDPLFVAPPTSFVITETTYLEKDGTVIPEIDVRWTASIDKFVAQYEFQWKLSSASVYQSALTVEPRIDAKYLDVGSTFNIRVRAINVIGAVSAWLSTTYTIAGDTTGPETPVGLTAYGSYKEATLTWTPCAAKDYKETFVYASTSPTFSGSTPIAAKITGNVVTYYNLAQDTTYYVWIRHFDFSGNPSSLSSRLTFNTTTGVSTSELAPNAATLFFGLSADFSPGVAIAETASNTLTDWTNLGSATVDFSGNAAEYVTAALSLNYEGQGGDTHVISLALVVNGNILARVDQSIEGAQEVTVSLTTTQPWSAIAPTAPATSVLFYAYTKIGAAGTDVEAISAYFNVLGSRR